MDYAVICITTVIALVGTVLFWILKVNKKISITVPGLDPSDPVQGNFPDIAKAGNIQDFLVTLHNTYGSVARFWWGSTLVVSIQSPVLFKQVSKLFSRPVEMFDVLEPLIGKGSVQLLNGEVALRIHTATSRCFSPKLLSQHFEQFNKGSLAMVDDWLGREDQDLIPVQEDAMSLTISTTLRTTLGNFFHNETKVKNIAQSYAKVWSEIERKIKGDPYEKDSERMQAFEENKAVFQSAAKEVLNYRKEKPPTDDSYLLIDAIIDLEMTESDAVDNIITYLIGSFHSSSFLLTWALYELANHPEIQGKMYEEVSRVVGKKAHVEPEDIKHLTYTQQVLSETLRRYIMAAFTGRIHDSEMELGGHKIPANTPIMIALGAQFKDPNYFPDPTRFDPERFHPENVRKRPSLSFEPFGFAGKRKCPGYRYAMAESQVFLANIIRHCEVSPPSGQVVTPVFGVLTTPKEQIFLSVKKRE